MKEELQNKLYEKYPEIFGDRTKPMTETCMCWGITTDDGWYHIIDNLCEDLMRIQEEYDVITIADQVKEKYGSLRFYYHTEHGKRWTIKKMPVLRFIDMCLHKIPYKISRFLHIPYNELSTYIHDRSNLLDGKLKITESSGGWIRYGRYMLAGPGVEKMIQESINKTESFSYITCERCGMTSGKSDDGYWISIRCDKCREEEKKQHH